jgi:hypothetical protein
MKDEEKPEKKRSIAYVLRKLNAHLDANFKSTAEAARHYKRNRQQVREIRLGERGLTPEMQIDIGQEKVMIRPNYYYRDM